MLRLFLLAFLPFLIATLNVQPIFFNLLQNGHCNFTSESFFYCNKNNFSYRIMCSPMQCLFCKGLILLLIICLLQLNSPGFYGNGNKGGRHGNSWRQWRHDSGPIYPGVRNPCDDCQAKRGKN